MTPIKTRLAAGGGILGATLGIIMLWEGFAPVAEVDTIGTGNPPTVCYGETIGVALDGQVHTQAECKAMLAARLPEYAAGMEACMVYPDGVPDKVYVASLSIEYNIGIWAFCHSTLVKKLNAGDLKGACNEFPRWVYASGRVVQGLVNRRLDEQRLCLEGVK